MQCLPSKFTDGYGSPLDRTGVCFNANASVVVRITDTCPCVYPNNAYSNRRWCCGDMDHLDISGESQGRAELSRQLLHRHLHLVCTNGICWVASRCVLRVCCLPCRQHLCCVC